MIKRLILTLSIFISFAIANSSLESKIAKLQTAPKEQRYKLMNQIKRELAKMNATQRNRALNQLKATMHSSSKASYGGSMGNHSHQSTKDMNSHMQNETKDFANKTHLHKQTSKPKRPHTPTKQGSPKTPNKPKNPWEHKKPQHLKGLHGK